MAGNIEVKILKINTQIPHCVVSIVDNGETIVKAGNIGLELNPDGTANTALIIDTAKGIVLNRRKVKAEQDSIDKITSTINSINSEE